ncbi:MAG TPA: hypothetical protein ENH94_11050 [Phycisphaerales bacterium]|nr:hypothetical protein [Phycisphaerales bacterium]
MNIKTWFCVGFLVVGLMGCSTKKTADPELPGIEAYAKAEVTIERMRKEAEPDWDAVKAQYEITSAIVKKYDAKLGMQYDSEIRQALSKCAAGDKVKVNQQTLAKGLQHVTVLAIRDELDGIDKSVSAKRIKAYFEGIRPSFVRRDKDFFAENKTLQTAADAALDRLAKADSADYLTARREIEDVIARTYGLCVLFEIMEIENLRNSDLAKCDVKRAEAVIFYRIIEPRIKKRSPRIAEIISNMLNGNYATMNSVALEKDLEAGLTPISLR